MSSAPSSSRRSNFGAIRITSNSSTLDIVSVTSTPGFGGTFGQTIPAVSFADLIPAGSSRSILYIREGDGFRSNLVLASGCLRLHGRRRRARLAGGRDPRDEDLLRSAEWHDADQPRRSGTWGSRVPSPAPVSCCRPRRAGAAFTGVASVIDETTNDPTAVLAQPASVSGSAPYIWLLPASAHSSGLTAPSTRRMSRSPTSAPRPLPLR